MLAKWSPSNGGIARSSSTMSHFRGSTGPPRGDEVNMLDFMAAYTAPPFAWASAPTAGPERREHRGRRLAVDAHTASR